MGTTGLVLRLKKRSGVIRRSRILTRGEASTQLLRIKIQEQKRDENLTNLCQIVKSTDMEDLISTNISQQSGEGSKSWKSVGLLNMPGATVACNISPQKQPPQKMDVEIAESEPSEEWVTEKEAEILSKGEVLKREKKAAELAALVISCRPFLNRISKAKAAKLVKTLVDMFLDMGTEDSGVEIDLCKECVSWAASDNRTFLRQSLEARLIHLYFEKGKYAEALALCTQLLKELKLIDDKHLLVKVLLLESKTYHALSNLSKARASLTSARTTANSIYIQPKLQAALDLQSGILHAADEKDFKTAFSYFYEAFEGYDGVDSSKALTTLKYMLLSKIMLNAPEDVHNITGGKLALTYKGEDIDAMRGVANAYKNRSLAEFQSTLERYEKALKEDVIVHAHLDTLYDNLLEHNLCRLIEPYSRVQVEYIAKKIALPVHQIEKKLSHMILDKRIHGILDQGEGILIVYEENEPDKTYDIAIDVINSMSKVVDTLYEKTKKLN